MNCPHCQSPLGNIEISTSDGQSHTVSECLNCGGHFLPAYLSNFLTIETARNLDSVLPKNQTVPTTSPVCPQCGQTMPGIKDDAVPQTVTIFTCPNGHGDFYPKNQLLLFKEAQQAKIYYHKVWGIPLKSAFAILIPLFVVFTAVTILPTIIKEVGTTQENRIKASEILTSPLITPISSSQVLISFSTKNPTKTSIKFTEGLDKTFQTSTAPQTNHLQSVDGLVSGTLYKYVIVLDTNGRAVTTSEYTFTAP
jgi:hypothetical protein